MNIVIALVVAAFALCSADPEPHRVIKGYGGFGHGGRGVGQGFHSGGFKQFGAHGSIPGGFKQPGFGHGIHGGFKQPVVGHNAHEVFKHGGGSGHGVHGGFKQPVGVGHGAYGGPGSVIGHGAHGFKGKKHGHVYKKYH